MFGWELPPYNSGGLGTACLGLARGLARRGVEVVFVLPKRINVDYPFMRIVFADEIAKMEARFVSGYCHKYRISGGWGDITDLVEAYTKGVNRIIAECDCDVVHGHDWLCFGAAARAKTHKQKPMIAQVHAIEHDRTGGVGANSEISRLEKMGMIGADKVVAVSKFTKDKIMSEYGIDEEKISVVHNGIDAEDHQSGSSEVLDLVKLGYKVVLFVGRLTLQKGPDYFLAVAAGVLKYCPKTVFVIAGSGDMQGQIVKQAVSMGIADKVMFAGFVRGDELAKLYRSADVYVMPSVSEPFGLVALEAMQHGTPVIMSKQSGVSEVVVSALKSDFWDIDNMINQIVGVLKYPALGKNLSGDSKASLEKMTWADVAGKMLDVYKEVG